MKEIAKKRALERLQVLQIGKMALGDIPPPATNALAILLTR